MSNKNQLSIFDMVLDKRAPKPVVQREAPIIPTPEPVAHQKEQIQMDDGPGLFEGVPIPKLEELIKMLDSASVRIGRHKLLSDVFECAALAISNQVDFKQAAKREERYKQIMNEYELKDRRLIADFFAKLFVLLSTMSEKYGRFNDWLGELYMRSQTSNSQAGQFFTPYSVSVACAKMACNVEVIEQKKKSGEILSISEPACGSGGMILAALDVLLNEHNFNYASQCFVEACDVDARCVHMCYLQLSLAGVPAIIKQQDTLSRRLWDVWYTPAYLFQYSKFKNFEEVARV